MHGRFVYKPISDCCRSAAVRTIKIISNNRIRRVSTAPFSSLDLYIYIYIKHIIVYIIIIIVNTAFYYYCRGERLYKRTPVLSPL